MAGPDEAGRPDDATEEDDEIVDRGDDIADANDTEGAAPDGSDDHLHEVWETRVRYEETDAQGVVYYGNYVTYQDETFSQYLREIGYPWQAMQENDWEIHVVHVDVDYHAPARFDDELVCGIRVDAIEESSIEFAWACRRADDGSLVADGGLTHVAVDENGRPTRVPDEFRADVVDFQDVPPEPV
jgi:acyl-CoA thioester hydrolase